MLIPMEELKGVEVKPGEELKFTVVAVTPEGVEVEMAPAVEPTMEEVEKMPAEEMRKRLPVAAEDR